MFAWWDWMGLARRRFRACCEAVSSAAQVSGPPNSRQCVATKLRCQSLVPCWPRALATSLAGLDSSTAPTVGLGECLCVEQLGSKVAIHDVGGGREFRSLWGDLYKKVGLQSIRPGQFESFETVWLRPCHSICPSRSESSRWCVLCSPALDSRLSKRSLPPAAWQAGSRNHLCTGRIR